LTRDILTKLMRSSGKHVAALLAVALSAAWADVHAQTTTSLRYETLHEQELRVAMSPASVADDFRVVVNRYWNFVRRYPSNGYVDNALWQAAILSMDAFVRFGEERDKHRAVQLFQWLRDHYPHSSFLPRASVHLEQLLSEPLPPSAPAGTTIRSVQRQVLPEVVRVTIELDREIPFYQERLESPARLFFDLKGTKPAPALIDAVLRYDSDIVRHVRLGRHPNNTTRVVLDLENVGRYSVFTLYKPYRIVIDSERAGLASAPTAVARRLRVFPVVPLARITPPAPLAPLVPDAPGELATRKIAVKPVVPFARIAPNSPAIPNVAAVAPRIPVTRTAPIPPPPPSAAKVSPPPPAPDPPIASTVPTVPGRPVTPSANSSGSFSVARQLGLGVSRVVIDAGHGGHDPGASAFDITEAEVVLDVALQLEKLLLQQPGMEVVLTRRTNDFLSLDERTGMANRASADLFLSIHANASASPTAQGVETYFLNFALNPQAEAVAARENAASGKTMNSLSGIVKAITLNSKLNESRDFAGSVQRALVRGLRSSNRSLKDLGVKQAPFMVLIGASMPSVLAEISFVTNSQEARLLKSSTYRQKIAESLLNGILRYQQSLKKVQTAVQSKDAGSVHADNRQGR
jgi:N-acetylmuramoyl-L-alanine amidase